MPDIPIPQPAQTQDVYAYDFNKQLYRFRPRVLEDEKSPVYDIFDETNYNTIINGPTTGLGPIVTGQIKTTDATPTSKTLFKVNVSQQQFLVDAYVIARRTGGSAGATGDSGSFKRTAAVKRYSSGSPSVMTMVQDAFTQRDQTGWNVDIVVTSSTVDIQVTGAANNNITWDYQVLVMYNTSV